MSKTHWSLSPIINVLFIPLWAVLAGLFVLLIEGHGRFVLASAGAALGVTGGVFQHLAFAQASGALREVSSLLEVRRCLKATPWGCRYIIFLYLSKALLLVLAFLMVRGPLLSVLFGYLAAYFSLMFTREITTLRDTFHLEHITANAPADTGRTAKQITSHDAAMNMVLHSEPQRRGTIEFYP